MKKHSPRPLVRLGWLILALVALLVAVGVLYPIGVQADGGKFPTKTPTVTSSPTVTLTPTLGPSPTWTLLPALTPVPLLGQEQPPGQPLAAPLTTPSQAASRSILACWPVALFVFLAIVVGATYLLTRRARLEGA